MTWFPSTAIVRRELITCLRGHASLLWFLLLFLGSALTIWGQYPVSQVYVREAGRVAETIFWYLSTVLMCGGILIVPAIASTSIAVEKQRDTFEQLTLTLVRPLGIVTAKVVNAFGVYLIFALAIMPVIASLFFLVGIGWRELMVTIWLVSMAAVTCSAVSVLSSVLCRTTVGAIVLSYIMVIAVMTGPALLAVASPIPLGKWLAVRLLLMTPFYAMNADGSGVPDPEVAVFFTAYHGFVTALCLALATWRLNKPHKLKVVRQAKPVDDPVVLLARRRTFPYYLFDPLKRKPPIEDGRNPIMVKEFRWGLLGRVARMVRVFYVSLIALTFWAIVQVLFAGDALGWELLHLLFFLLLVPMLACTSLTREFEEGNIEMLKTTVLTSREIVRGKVFSVLLMLSPLLLASFLVHIPAAIGAGWWGGRNAIHILAGFPTILVCMLVTLAVSVRMSVSGRATHRAILSTYAASLMVLIGIWLFCMFGPFAIVSLAAAATRNSSPWLKEIVHRLYWIGNSVPDNQLQNHGQGWLGAYLMALSPLIAFLNLAPPTPRWMGRRSFRWWSRLTSGLVASTQALPGHPRSLVPWIMSLAFFTVIAWGILCGAERAFERRRTEQ